MSEEDEKDKERRWEDLKSLKEKIRQLEDALEEKKIENQGLKKKLEQTKEPIKN